MKKFVNPEVDVQTLNVENVMTTSNTNSDVSNPTPED